MIDVCLTCPECEWPLTRWAWYMGRTDVWVCYQCFEIWG